MNVMNGTGAGIQPLGSLLVLDVTPAAVTTAGGLAVPVAARPADLCMEATVVARGPECVREELRPGCRVYVGKYVSHEIVRRSRKYRLAQEAEVLAVLS